MTRIAILADTSSRARHLETLLAEDDHIEIVDARAFAGHFADIRVDVVLAVGLSAASAAHFDVPVVLISDGRPKLTGKIRAALPVSALASEISAAIQAAANDLTVFTPEQVLRWLPAGRQPLDNDAPVEELTGRELQVLRMIADGNGNKEIALTLVISEHTVKFHVAQILAKLNAASRTEAVSLGIRRGLIAI